MKFKLGFVIIIACIAIVCVCIFISRPFVIEVSESTVNTAITSVFPRESAGINIHGPKIQFTDGKAIVCAVATIKFSRNDVSFCATLIPEWRPETSSLHATNLALTSLSMDGMDNIKSQIVKDTINRYLSRQMEGGFQLYQIQSLVGKKVSSVTIGSGKVALAYQMNRRCWFSK